MPAKNCKIGPRQRGPFSFHTKFRFMNKFFLLVQCLFLLVLSGCDTQPESTDVKSFLATHWQDPVPAQGEPPSSFSELESSLGPESCGACHPAQYQDWKTALHSHTMGAGIGWQFALLGQEESNRCLRCHAPLAEQKALLAKAMAWSNAPKAPAPNYVPVTLAESGLTCAACHVRKHQRYGPPSRTQPTRDLAHNGFTPSKAFEDSLFCAHCHQFPEDGPRLAGKLREDTYQQWLASSYAGKQTCQDCHMPERKHLWRGVHDPEMLRKALALDLELEALDTKRYRAKVVAKNIGAGHHLPTYMVAKIDLVYSLHRAGAEPVEIARDVIGWKADVNMKQEEFDTRLPAGASRHYAHDFVAPDKPGWFLELRVDVAPREHYERMFKYSLVNVPMPGKSSDLLKTAIDEAVGTRYTAMRLTSKP